MANKNKRKSQLVTFLYIMEFTADMIDHDKTYQDIITTFVLNTMLHHVCMLRIIETHEQLKYDTDKKNP